MSIQLCRSSRLCLPYYTVPFLRRLLLEISGIISKLFATNEWPKFPSIHKNKNTGRIEKPVARATTGLALLGQTYHWD